MKALMFLQFMSFHLLQEHQHDSCTKEAAVQFVLLQ